jgi:hypothetical protein
VSRGVLVSGGQEGIETMMPTMMTGEERVVRGTHEPTAGPALLRRR